MDTKRYVVFPQANSVALILETLNEVSKKQKKSKKEIAETLGIVLRQVDYYVNVLYFFELISENNKLTLKGKYINDPIINPNDRNKILKNIMIEKPIFAKIDKFIIDYNKIPPLNIIADYIAEEYLFSPSTLYRRASTVKSWFDYFIKNKVYEVNIKWDLIMKN